MKKNLLVLYVLFLTGSAYSQNWTAVGQGLNGLVLTMFADTASGRLYAGGAFSASGSLQLHNVGYWDGVQWNAMGLGFNGIVHNIKMYNGEVYAIGDFTYSDTTALNYIAKWNGSGWVNVGSGLNANGLSLFSLNGDLYAGGNFTIAGGQTCNYVAKWNGTNWQSLDNNITSTNSSLTVMTIGSFQNELVIGGNFIAEGTANHISILSAGVWQPLSVGTNSFVTSVNEVDNELVVTGYFNLAGGISAICIAKWDGSSWLSFPSPSSSLVNCQTLLNSNLIVGGNFNSFLNGSISSHCIADYEQTNQSWTGITTGMNGSLYALAAIGNTLYAGGGFDTAGTSEIFNIAKIDATTIGIEKIPFDPSIQVFPNPFTDKLNIKGNFSDYKKMTVQVTDVLGREIKPTINLSDTGIEIERGNIPKGIYFLKLWNDNQLLGEAKLIAL
jgi:hypothetical protein